MTYETLGFLEKNRDTLKVDVSQLLRASENQIIQSLFQTPLSRTGGLSPASTVNKVPLSATPLFSRKGPPMVGTVGSLFLLGILVYSGTSLIQTVPSLVRCSDFRGYKQGVRYSKVCPVEGVLYKGFHCR